MVTLNASSVSSVLKVLLPLGLIIWTLSYLGFTKPEYRSEVARKFRDQKALFVADFLEHEIDGRFNGGGIQKLCAGKQWTHGLIFSCAPATGGIGVVRNQQLHCIRLAIESGGTFGRLSIPTREGPGLQPASVPLSHCRVPPSEAPEKWN